MHTEVVKTGGRAEPPPVGVGADPEVTVEYAPQGLGTAQPAAFGHHVERVVAGFELGTCGLEPDPFHEPSRALADLGGEHPGEVAHAHRRRGGERGQPVITAGRGLDAVLDGPDRRALGPGHPDRRGELGLAARPVQKHDQPPGQRLGDVGAQVVGDQSERQIDARGDPGAGPDVAVANVERVGVHVNGRVFRLQLLRRGPVGGHPAPVEQPGGGGDESARAHRRDPPAPAGRGTDEGDQVRVGAGRSCTRTARQHQGVDPLARARQRRGAEFQAALTLAAASTTRLPHIRPWACRY